MCCLSCLFKIFIIIIIFNIPHMSEILWYLSFFVFVILLSIIPSRSKVHPCHYKWLGSIMLCVYMSSLSILLLIDTWVASISWLLYLKLQWTLRGFSSFFCLIFFHCSWFTMACQFSTVQKGDAVTHTYIHSFFSHYHTPS